MEEGDTSSGAASFVKRRKPKRLATRVSSAYDEPDDASQAAGPSIPTTASGTSASSTPRRMLSRGGSDEEQEPDAGGVVFRPRARGARSTPTAASISSKPTARGASNGETAEGDDNDDDEPVIAVRRLKSDAARKPARMSGVGMSALSSSSTSTPKRSTPLRPTAFKDAAAHEQAQDSTTTSSLYTSKYLEELRTSTPTARSRAHSPAPAPPGPATFMDDPMAASSSRLGLAPGDDDSLARTKYAADFEHDAIPSESVIRAAKEKRAKLRAAGVTSGMSEDFISLAPYSRSSAVQAYDAMEEDDGPHPHSRLQREEDELGDGEDEFAEYTGATERIPIGAKAEEEFKHRQRRQMEAAVRGDFDDDAPGGMVDEMDEDEEEWERAQLRRTQPAAAAAASREASPFRAAPIPEVAPVPSVGTCSARLQLTLRALEQSTAAADAVIASTRRELEVLDKAEEENKLDVTAVEEKASWFDELDEFVASLARFIGEKTARVDEVESDAVALIARRTAMLDRARAAWLEARWEEAFGMRPSKTLIPSSTDEADERDSNLPERLGGDAASAGMPLDELDAADQLSLDLAQREIIERLNATFSDVQAPEYLDPIASIDAGSSNHSSSGLPLLGRLPADWTAVHPRSVMARFEEWRRRYPDEYAQVWGGLSVGQIWEFYARLEMVAWDAFRAPSGSGWSGGAEAVAHFRWFAGASEYTERGMRSANAPVGGDDEVLASLTANVLVPKLTRALGAGCLSIWSEVEVAQLVEVVDIVQTVLGDTHARYVSLVEAVLGVFAIQIQRLQDSLAETRGAIEGHAMAMADVLRPMLLLVRSTMMLARVVKPSSATDSPTALIGKRLVHLVEQLTIQVVQPILLRLFESPATQSLAATIRQSLMLDLAPTITAHSPALIAFTSSTH